MEWSILARFFAKTQQKLGIILENKMSENWSYQKMSSVKVAHLNLYFFGNQS